MKEIGLKIKENRIKSDLSQEELSQKINVTRQAVSKWERSESLPDIENIILLADLFKISSDELLGRIDSKEQSSKYRMFANVAFTIQLLAIALFVVINILFYTDSLNLSGINGADPISNMSNESIIFLSIISLLIAIILGVGMTVIVLFIRCLKYDNLDKLYKYSLIVLFISQVAGLFLFLSYNQKKKLSNETFESNINKFKNV